MDNKQINKSLKSKTGKDLLNLINSQKENSEKLNYSVPEGEVETALFGFWESLLGHGEFGVNDDFFKCGGNSIKAIQLISRISSRFLIQLDPSDVFLQPTISQLAALVQIKLSGHPSQKSKIVKQERPEHIPLSFSQERLLFIDSLDGSIQYHLPGVFRLKGNLDKNALETAFQQIVNRHEVLRTVFLEKSGETFQNVKENFNWHLGIINGADYLNNNEALRKFVQQLINVPFDLSKDNMLRADLISFSEDDFLLIVTMHHIASDGWSITILVNELIDLYNSLVEGHTSGLHQLNLQYADYAIWQRKYMQGGLLSKKLEYWKKKLKGITTLQLITDYPRPAVQSIRGAISGFIIENELRDKLKLLSNQFGVTLYVTLLSAFKILLYRYSGQNDISVGTPVAGRQQQELEELIGFFINTLVLRSEVDGSVSFSDFLLQIKANTLDAFENQDVPFEKVVEAVVKGRDHSRSPLFQVAFVFHNTPQTEDIGMRGVEIIDETAEQDTAKFELTFSFIETSEELAGEVEFCSDLYKRETIERMIGHFLQLLKSITDSPEEIIDRLSMITKPEENKLLNEFNNTEAFYPKDKTIVNLFEEQAAKTSGNVALVFEDQTLTYKELNELSNQLAHYLQSKGVKNETPVPVCMERNTDLIIAILGILKSGGAYVPIDPEYPEERIRFMIENTTAKILISSDKNGLKFPFTGEIQIIKTDRDHSEISKHSTENLQLSVEPHNLAYVVYTSGSTGRPKGVMVEHSGVVNLIAWHNRTYQVTGSSRSTAMSGISFDAFGWEILPYLCAGASINIVDDDTRLSPHALLSLLNSKEITHSFIPTALVPEFISASRQKLKSLKYLLTGGDKLTGLNIEEESFKLVNNYGPTENTVVTTFYELSAKDKNLIPPIGKPISNIIVRILDKNSSITAIGIGGEICIGGAGLARGYLNLTDLTEEKFIKDPFAKEDGVRLYKTGDLGRWLPDGNIEFLDRMDAQVMIRGFRIELGEIENVLLQHSSVKQAGVIAREDEQGSKYLTAYIASNGQFNREEIAAYLESRLPDYMIPSQFVELESLPLTKNGKLDKKAFPADDAGKLSDVHYVAPRNETETILAELWSEVLSVEKIGIHDDFFELGGHSLLVIRLVSAIRSKLEVEVDINSVFENSTIESLAEHIQKLSIGLQLPLITLQQRPERIPLSFAQERLWFIDELEGSIQYHIPAVIELKGKLNTDALVHSLKSIVNRHEILRTVIRETEGVGYQHINDKNDWELKFIESSEITDSGISLQDYILKEINTPFDLSEDYMLRGHLIRINDEEHILVLTLHHIASDGSSTSIIITELSKLYKAYIEKRESALPELPLQYADYAIWRRNYLQGEVLEKKLEYWKEKLEGVKPLQLPADFKRPAVQSTKGAYLKFDIDQELSDKLYKLNHQSGTTTFMTLLGALKVLLFRYSGQNDICVGTPTANRNHVDLEGLIGLFLNTLPLRSDVRDDCSFNKLLQQIKSTTLEAFSRQEAPFEKIVDAVVKERDISMNPIFQVMLATQSKPEFEKIKLGELEFSVIDNMQTTSQLDLVFYVTETESGMTGGVEYCTELFSEKTIKRMSGHLLNILNSIVTDPEQNIGELQLLSHEEEHQLLKEFNSTEVNFQKNGTFLELFEEKAKHNPDSVAVIFEQERLTYKELNDLANEFACYLNHKGIKKETLVPICIERGTGMLVGILGILKSGGAFVPVDPEYPLERITYILDDTNSEIVVSSKKTSAKILNLIDSEVIDIDGDWSGEGKNYVKSVPALVEPEQLAYVIYTSGSTGNPKGVMIEHRSLSNLLLSMTDEVQFNSDSVFLSVTSFSFDICYLELFMPLITGGKLIIASRENSNDGYRLANSISYHKPTHMQGTPSTWHLLMDSDWKNQENIKILVGGEELKDSLKDQLTKIGSAINLYGPTETTIWSTKKELKPNEKVLIGTPIANTQIQILSRENRLLPIGVTGEILIGGTGLARGYFNREELTTEKFIQDPLSNNPGSRLYKTGDLGRWLEDGNIDFIGRIDHQIKLRGYRIELGEIESVLQQSGLVHQSVVLAKEDYAGNKRLVGYVVSEGIYDKLKIISYLQGKLPEYMIPNLWVKLEHFPLTPNGKIDRKALPDPEVSEMLSDEYLAPRNETEEQLAEIWQELLGIDKVGINANFFELGGHSLLAMRVISMVRRKLEFELAIKNLFLHPTIAELAVHLDIHNRGLLLPSIEVQPRPDLIPLSFSQERLWFIDRLEGSIQYHIPSVLRLRGKLNQEALAFSLKSIVNRHETLRTVIRETEGVGYQFIKEADDWELEITEGSRYVSDIDSLQAYIKELINVPFDLAENYMLRGNLIKLSEDDHLLVVSLHHIASDGWSTSIIVRELAELYQSYSEGREGELKPLPLQYADYAIWQRDFLSGEVLDRKVEYWKGKLEGIEPLQLPTDYMRPAVQSTEGAFSNFIIDKDLSDKLQDLSLRNGTTLFMTLIAAYKVFLYRYSGQHDICIGTPIAGRQQQEVEGLIGFFVNSLALRSNVNDTLSFTEFLQVVKTNILEAYEYQEVPFEIVVDAVLKGRDINKNPLFQVMFALQNIPDVTQIKCGDLQLNRQEYGHTTSKFDLTFFMSQTPAGLQGSVEYCTDLYNRQTIEQMTEHFNELLSSIVKHPEQRIGSLNIITETEKQKLLRQFNDTIVEYPKEKSIIDLFEEQVLMSPDKIALIFEDVQFTYKELDELSNRLSHYLKTKIVSEETLIPICIDRSPEMIIGILGILKTGAAYVPIDPAYPEERINYILRDIYCPVIVTTTEHHKIFSADTLSAEVIYLDSLNEMLTVFPADKPACSVKANHLAYVMYTSGSTGKPKGVMVEHGNVVSLVKGNDNLSLTDKDILLSTGSPSFDATTFEYWGMLLNGGQLILCSENTLLDSEALKSVIVNRQVNKMWFISSLFNQHVETDITIFEGLETIIAGGEKLSEQHVYNIIERYPHLKIINGYGPTENTTFSLTQEITNKDIRKAIPIGRPLSNRTAYILDQWHNPVGIGIPGEIYVGGAGLSRGYFNNPELTAEKFIKDPFSQNPEAKLYRTGDLGRWLPGGEIEFLGRRDYQVKIRGHRIELGEIESVLNNLEEVSSSCVVTNEEHNVTNKISAYYVPAWNEIKSRESELYEKRIEIWKELYESEYSKIDDQNNIDHEFDITGWNDSFTGSQIPEKQMREWLDDITNVILSENPERVLEIGCGTGLIYYSLCGHIKKYTGVDFSQKPISQILNQIIKNGKEYPETDLKVGLAHEIELNKDEKVDTIILNSIIQYFPGEKYLSDVLEKSISILNGHGTIIVGDVRDYRLLKLFRSRLYLENSKDNLSIRDFEWGTEQEILREEELCLSPEYFYNLRSNYPEITHIDIQWKQGNYINELTAYRYTVIIHVGIEKELIQPEWLSWDTIESKEDIIDQFSSGKNIIAIKDVPNPRLNKEALLEKGISDKSVRTVRDLKEFIAESDSESNSPEEILSLAKDRGYRCRIMLDKNPLKMNLLFHLRPIDDYVKEEYNGDVTTGNSLVSNVPLLRDVYSGLKKDIFKQLKVQLPEYMIPSDLFALQYLPLTDNGKVDRSFLRNCGELYRSSSLDYQEPVTEFEIQLASIWRELLGRQDIGINDNFFELGGDSILTIQVVSRAKRLGYSLQPKDLFIHQTIARLSKAISEHHGPKSRVLREVESLRGNCGLLPIQQRFFEECNTDTHHFNQSVLLDIDKSVTKESLSRAIKQLTDHHDSLRFRYYKEDGNWKQEYGTSSGELITVDLKSPRENSLDKQIEEHADKYQRSLDLEKGKLSKFVLMLTPDSEPFNRLLIIIHHLAVDGVSWRILMEDFAYLLNVYKKNEKADLIQKGSSYRQWYNTLQKYSQSERLLSQKDYWLNVVKNYHPFETEKKYNGEVKAKHLEQYSIQLDSIQTKRLIQEVPGIYHSEVNDILISALARSISELSSGDQVFIGLEGHGREEISDDIDTSRTTGWFTSLFPVMLNIGESTGEDSLIKSVKEQLRGVPDKGLGYGVLRYLNKDDSLQGKNAWDITFNYLGQLDNVVSGDKMFALASETSGAGRSEEQVVSEILSVNCYIQSGELTLTWIYSNLHFEKETISGLAQKYKFNLEKLITHCLEKQKSGAVFTPSDFGLSPYIKYQELDRFLAEKINGISRKDLIEGIYKLSGLQSGIFFHSIYEEGSGAYMEQFSCELIGLNQELFRKSWDFVIQRHSILRSAFYDDAFGIPVQCVYKEAEMPLEILDYRRLNEMEQVVAINQYEKEDLKKGFDFSSAPVMRAALIRLSGNRYRMLWTFHHILFDGWSLQVLLEEFLNTYDLLASGNQIKTDYEDKFEDFVRYLERRDVEQEKKYWRNYMKDREGNSLLPFINTTSERNKGSGNYEIVSLHINTTAAAKIQNFAHRHRITVNTIFQGVWSYLLHQYTGSDDVTYGVVVSGRPEDLPEMEQRVGMYINTLPLRSVKSNDQNIVRWLHDLQEDQVTSRRYQFASLNDIQNWSETDGDLFDSIMAFENYPVSKIIASNKWSLQIENVKVQEKTNYPLNITIVNSEHIDIAFSFNSGLLDEKYVKKIRDHFEFVLMQIVENGERSLNEIDLLSQSEKHQLLNEFNNNAAVYPDDKSLIDLYEEQVLLTPDSVALIFENEQLTYRELNERSNQLANYLIKKGIKPGSNIGLLSLRNFEMIIGMFGILKSGCSYVPFNTKYPGARLNYIIEDTGIKHIVCTDKELLKDRGLDSYECIDVKESNSCSVKSPGIKTGIDSGAYVMFTSGTTSRPKGIAVSHRNIIKLVYDSGTISVRPNDRVLQWSNYSFDGSTYDIYCSLLKGASLCLIKDNIASDADELMRVFKEQNISVVFITTALFNAIIDIQPEVLKGLRKILFGGEKVSFSHVRRALNELGEGKIVHVYGPTETTVYATGYPVNEIRSDGVIPIGKPLSNTKLFVLNDLRQPVPAGVSGELYIGGDGVSLGYVNNEELNQEKFISNPFSKNGDGKFYRTGDIVRWLPDGNIDYLGRIDEQVKIRGYRIEPGEIESVLQQSESVKQAVVTAREDKQGTKYLVGYIVSDDFNREEIETYLKSKLPEYMIPSQFVELKSLPLTPNGKVDKKALPDPDSETLQNEEFVAPRNETESALTEIWTELLEVDRIGVHDDFFELGGHSLLAMRAVSSIRRRLRFEISVKDLFHHRTISELAVELKSKSSNVLLPPIVLNPRPEHIPLSFSQERLWFIDRLEGSTQYHIPAVLKLKGNLNSEALEYALKSIVDRHEVLRTVIYEKDGVGYQHINDAEGWKLKTEPGSGFTEDSDALKNHIKELIKAPFDLSEDFMMRGNLISINEHDHLLVLTLHHIASDGWSTSIMVKELLELYESYIEKTEAQLSTLPLQYSDFAMWQRNYLQGDVLEKRLRYWKDKLGGVSSLQLPTDFERPAVQSTRGANSEFIIDKELSGLLQELSLQHGTTLFMTLLSAFNVLLFRYSSQKDICVGSPIAGRQQEETEALIGFFVNTLALRSEVSGDLTFAELLRQIRTTTLEAYEHQDAPFEQVVEAVVKQRDMSRSPLFQVMFALQNTPDVPEPRLSDLNLTREIFEYNISKFDLSFFMTETPEGLQGSVEYCSDLYSEKTIERMINHFGNLLRSIAENPQQSVGLIPMLNVKEENQLLNEFNETASDYPKDKGIIDLFEEQVLKTPEDTALVFDEQKLTYRQLNESANKLAHYLKSKGVKEGALVPICIGRSVEMITGVIAILKTGGAYVPVDPDYPQDRIELMIENTGAALVLGSKETKSKLQVKSEIEIIEIDYDNTEIKKQSAENLKTKIKSESPAYVLYTSGSTGTPKGVIMPGSNLVNLLSWQEKQFVNKQRRVLQFTSLNFDVSFQEIFSTLCFGGALYLISAERRIDMSEVLKDISKHKITHLFVPFIVLKNLAEHISSQSGDTFSIEEIITAGEQLKVTDDIVSLINKNGITIYNQYGPTEAHVVSSYKIHKNSVLSRLPPIGKPVNNTQLYILSENNKPVPVGVTGELHIAGVQLASGYLNHPELTEEKFIKNSFIEKADSRMYKTGDLCRWLPDGNIEYIGRTDDQIKIRGYRVELGEIESVLQQNDAVNNAVVLAKEDSEGNKRLIGYIVPEEKFNREEITSYLRSKLPEYMIPSILSEIESMPVTANGKIDKKALPDPDMAEFLKNEYTVPRNETEEKLAAIWEKLLGVERAGIHDNFFELGGHSLLAMRVISSIRKDLNTELAIKDLFLHPTIAELSAQMNSQGTGSLMPAIKVQTRPMQIPLSFSQERLWFIDRLEGSTQFHLPAVLRLEGKLNEDALTFALKNIVNRHEVLRTVIKEEEGKGYQLIKDKDDWDLQKVDGSKYKENPDDLQNYIHQLINAPFDLSEDYMMRGHLIRINENDHLLVLTMHHIASDGWSISVVVKELAELYAVYEEGRETNLTKLSIQYTDYAIWQRDYLKGEILEKKLDYWKEKLIGTEPLQLPTDYTRPEVQSIKGAIRGFSIDKELADQLHMLSRKNEATLFMTLLSVIKVLLHRYSGQEDICVGSPIAGRQQEEVEELIGFFINTLALRSQISGEDSFSKLLKQVKETTLEAYQNQEAPFEKVVEAVVKQRDMSRSPLFQVMFALQNTPEIPELRLGELNLSGEVYEHNISKYDLSFSIRETSEDMQCSIEYCTDLYNEDTIDRMIVHFKELLRSVVTDPDQKIGLLNMLTKSEERQLLIVFNDTQVDYPLDKSIVDLFEEQVTKTPDAAALKFEKKQITYADLNERSNRLAHYLKSKGVRIETLVPLCIERGFDMIVGILGILKAGGAYVPVDPEYPMDRISYMLEDTASTIIVTSSECSSKLPDNENFTVINLDEDRTLINEQSALNLSTEIQPDNLAYVIYTSGSTGKPKGVMTEHKGIVNLITNQTEFFKLGHEERILQFSNYCFDASAEQIFLALFNGACLILFEEGLQLDKNLFEDLLKKEKISHLHAAPIFLENISVTDNTYLKRIVSGGDVCSKELSNRFKAKADFYNKYGPTETTVTSVEYKDSGDTFEKLKFLPIGKPINNTLIYILGKQDQLLPVGIPGEIHIGGEGLSRGYLNREELTAKKFVSDPFNGRTGQSMYKSGDVGRWLPDGNIEFLGRIDDQVKIRGYRVELGEIENVLLQSKLINKAVVLAREDKDGNKRLIGYVVSKDETDREALTSYLKSKLPGYMVPSLWVVLENLPLTSGGKVDRNALPDPDAGEMISNEYTAPSNELERALAGIWQDLLGVETVGINDNFFELGGHSLLALQLFSHIEKLTGRKFAISALFSSPTIKELAKIIDDEGWTPPWKTIIPLKSGGSRLPFFILPPAATTALFFQQLVKYIPEDQPMYLMESLGLDGKEQPHTDFVEMAAFHVKEMRALQPNGPYLLGGRCFGGRIVYEMAQQLVRDGQEVALLAVFDTWPPFVSKPSEEAPQTKDVNYLLNRTLYHMKSGAVLKVAKNYLSAKLYRFQRNIRGKLKYLFLDSRNKLYERIRQSHFRAQDKYVAKKYPGKITLIESGTFDPKNRDGWKNLAEGGFETYSIENTDHVNIMIEPNIKYFAGKLNSVLEKTHREIEGKTYTNGAVKKKEELKVKS